MRANVVSLHCTGRGVMKLHGTGTTSSRGYGSACLEDERVNQSPYSSFLENCSGSRCGPYSVYPSGMSWDEVLGKMSSGKKFYHDAISGADSACNDELRNNSFTFCRENGQCTEDSYSYTSSNVEPAPGSVTGYRDVSTDNELDHHRIPSSVAWSPSEL